MQTNNFSHAWYPHSKLIRNRICLLPLVGYQTRKISANGFADRYLSHLSTDRWRSDFVADGREECRNYFIRTNVVPNTSAVVFRKAVYEEVGGADENYRICGDWKLWAAMALTGKVAYFGEPLNYFRFHDASVRSISRYDWSRCSRISSRDTLAVGTCQAEGRSPGSDVRF